MLKDLTKAIFTDINRSLNKNKKGVASFSNTFFCVFKFYIKPLLGTKLFYFSEINAFGIYKIFANNASLW